MTIYFAQAYGSQSGAGSQPIVIVYMFLFLLAQLTQLVLVIDAAYSRNTMQVVATALFNFCSFCYSIFQTIQVNNVKSCGLISDPTPDCAVFSRTAYAYIAVDSFDSIIIPLLVVIIVLMGLFNLVGCYVAFQVYQEYGWSIVRIQGADLNMKRMNPHL